MTASRRRWSSWFERMVTYVRRAIGAEGVARESLFARSGEDRWTTPRRYEERDLRVVSWADRRQ